MKIRDVVEGYTVLPAIDKEKYQARSGLEGPFRLKNGKVVYYDPQEGKYYDPDSDLYIEYDDYKKMDEGAAGWLAGAALLASIWGVGNYQAQQAYDASPQLQKLTAYLEIAKKHGDERMIDQLEDRIEAHKSRLSLDMGDVRGDDGKPIDVVYDRDGYSTPDRVGKVTSEAEVSNTDYEWTHGKKPKGTGSWFFVAHKGGVNFGKDVEGEDYIELHGMSYADAKRAAIKWAKSKGHSSLFVGT